MDASTLTSTRPPGAAEYSVPGNRLVFEGADRAGRSEDVAPAFYRERQAVTDFPQARGQYEVASAQAADASASASAGSSTGVVVARLIVAVALAALAFPSVPASAYRVAVSSAGGAAVVGVILAMSVVMALMRFHARRGEPPVHDRQLDVVLAMPFLGASAWLALAWPDIRPAGAALTNPAVMGFVSFLIGASLLMLGTRLTARIRWALLVPLLAAPLATGVGPWWAALAAFPAALHIGTMLRWRMSRPERSNGHHYTPALRSSGIILLVAVSVALCIVTAVLQPAASAHWGLLMGNAR